MGWKVIPAQIARVDDKGVKSVLAQPQLPVLCVSPLHILGASSRARVSKNIARVPIVPLVVIIAGSGGCRTWNSICD